MAEHSRQQIPLETWLHEGDERSWEILVNMPVMEMPIAFSLEEAISYCFALGLYDFSFKFAFKRNLMIGGEVEMSLMSMTISEQAVIQLSAISSAIAGRALKGQPHSQPLELVPSGKKWTPPFVWAIASVLQEIASRDEETAQRSPLYPQYVPNGHEGLQQVCLSISDRLVGLLPLESCPELGKHWEQIKIYYSLNRSLNK
ncbi:MAG TPA: hypothetical protein V6D07_19135 [Trichocoleus sp.]